jgi:hypothetical protein
MTIAVSIFLKELNVSAGTPKTADHALGCQCGSRMPPTCKVERRDGTGACRIIGHWLFLVSVIASAAGDKTVNACTGRGCGPGQACSAQDLATTNRHHSPLRQYASKRHVPKRDSLQHELR